TQGSRAGRCRCPARYRSKQAPYRGRLSLAGYIRQAGVPGWRRSRPSRGRCPVNRRRCSAATDATEARADLPEDGDVGWRKERRIEVAHARPLPVGDVERLRLGRALSARHLEEQEEDRLADVGVGVEGHVEDLA